MRGALRLSIERYFENHWFVQSLQRKKRTVFAEAAELCIGDVIKHVVHDDAGCRDIEHRMMGFNGFSAIDALQCVIQKVPADQLAAGMNGDQAAFVKVQPVNVFKRNVRWGGQLMTRHVIHLERTNAFSRSDEQESLVIGKRDAVRFTEVFGSSQ